MAIGRPILTTTAPGCDDTVQEGYNGFKVDVGDIRGLSKKLQELIENKELRIQMGENSRKFFLEKFTLENAGLDSIKQLKFGFRIFDVPSSVISIEDDKHTRNNKIIHEFVKDINQENLLEYQKPNLKRCTNCILPETMPFIEFNSKGVCNYCENYKNTRLMP